MQHIRLSVNRRWVEENGGKKFNVGYMSMCLITRWWKMLCGEVFLSVPVGLMVKWLWDSKASPSNHPNKHSRLWSGGITSKVLTYEKKSLKWVVSIVSCTSISHLRVWRRKGVYDAGELRRKNTRKPQGSDVFSRAMNV